MVGATVLGVFLQGLPPDRRVAMARVASLIRRAARGVRESKRFGLVFYELNGGPLFGLESREKSLTLYIAERSVIEPFLSTMKGIDAEHSLIEFTDLNRLPLPDIEKIVRASVVARRERQTAPSQSEILAMWGVKEEEAAVAPPVVRISMRTAEDEQAEAAAKAEAERLAAENKKILRPTRPEKSQGQSSLRRKERRQARCSPSYDAPHQSFGSLGSLNSTTQSVAITASQSKNARSRAFLLFRTSPRDSVRLR